jgi:hypothetical protein
MTTLPSEDPLRQVRIVVPVGPGDRAWQSLCDALRTHAASAEIRWVFAEHDTQAQFERSSIALPGEVVVAPPGRAAQQNVGAAMTQRPWLWFLHADSQPEVDVFEAMRTFLARDEPALGWFRLRFADEGVRDLRHRMRINAAGANWRSRWLGLPFGDQGLTLPTAAFERLGGFDAAMPYGEDFALAKRAKRSGLPLRELPAFLDTSPRKYAKRGWLRTTARHLQLTATLAWREARR